MFSPKLAVLAALLVSGLLALILLSTQGAKAGAAVGTTQAVQAAGSAPAQAASEPPTAGEPDTSTGSGRGNATLDLAALNKSNSLAEVDNVRWSLVRSTGDYSQLYNAKTGVDWAALRKVTRSGSYALKAGATWSFNATYQEGVGYRIAAGVIAGGQCALATVIRGAAIKAGLPNQAKPHRYPVPGFPLAQTVNIWWGRDDLTIRNPISHDLTIAWKLTPESVSISIY
jgi:hypothetical protein